MEWSSIAAQVDRILNVRLFTIADTPITAVTLIVLLAVLLFGFWFARTAARAVAGAARGRGVDDIGTIALVQRLVHYLIVLVVAGIGLQTIGIDLTAVFAAGAFIAIAAGFAMQNIAQNFVAGFILLADRTIRTGDILEVEGRVVRVTKMGLRATIARSRDEEDFVIPNSVLAQSTVLNYTLQDRIYRIKAGVGVTYDSDLDLVSRVLRDTAEGLEWRLDDHEPRVLLTEFGSSSVDFEVHIWISDPWIARRRTSELKLAVWTAFRRHGITIAFPQLDVHFDRHVEDSIRALAS